jgi:exodeoxyribonuclease V alpha subunit
MEELICKIVNIVFVNRQTGFFVLKAIQDGSHKQVTVRGSVLGLNISTGLKLKCKGKYEDNPTYGRQFHAVMCEVVPEQGKTGVITYLTNHVKSVGPVTASRLYDTFGDDLLRVLDEEPDRIKEIPFLTRTQITSLLLEWNTASAARTTTIFLTDLGLSNSQVKSILTVFGIDVRKIIEKNPYSLSTCPGIGFVTADQVARKLGVKADDKRRLRAIILFLMEDLAKSEGHVYVTSSQIFEHAKKVFKRNNIEPFSHSEYISEPLFYIELSNMKADKDVIANDSNLYLPHHWLHESESAKQISAMLNEGGTDIDINSLISEFEASKKLTLSDEQRIALSLLRNSRMCVISGYPGTGKTTLVSAFVHIFEHMNLDYILLSPTGIASKRLSQVTGKPAYTIHRALGCDQDGNWEFNAANKYVVDAVIVDEMSMVDASTFYHLITALPPTTVVVLVGDTAQLPSVGAGYVLHELMRCEHVPRVSLTRIYRQEGCSDIVEMAHAVLRGDDVDTSFRKKSEFIFLPVSSGSVMQEVIKLTSLMKSRADAHPADALTFQVIAPMYNGSLGVNELNKQLRKTLNNDFIAENTRKIKHGEVDIYEGDRIMITKNNYDRMIFNGDVGKVQRISIKQDEVEVRIFNWFDAESRVPRYVDKIFTFKVEEARTMMKVAYACTVHKCQGQEFDYVVMPMTTEYGVMLYRNLIYTAITRAKKKVFIFGDPVAFKFAVENDRETIRNSNLSGLILS